MSIVKDMLKNEDIKGWYHEMLFSGAEITITTYLRRLSAILKQMNETPESFIKMSPEDRYEKMLNYALEEQKRGRAPSYIVSEFKAIYSFLKYKGVYFKRIPNPKKAMSTPTVADETIPNPEELERILQVAKPRDKVSICLMAFAGVRPAVIGDLHGNNGLTLGDIEGISIEKNTVTVEPPLKVTIPENLSKTSYKYFTFLCEEGALHLRNYLEIRLKDGEKIMPSSPIVRSIHNKKKFVCTNAILRGIKISFKKAGINKRPYVLRRYFASKMLLGEYKGIMPHSFSQFMMGHKGEMMDQYTLHKGLLTVQIDNIKEAYRKCYKYIQTGTSLEELEETNARLEKVEAKNETLEEMLLEKLKKSSEREKQMQKQIDELKQELHDSKMVEMLLSNYTDGFDRLRSLLNNFNGNIDYSGKTS